MKANQTRSLRIVILGASGDLALRKIFPGLFALSARGLLPGEATFHGFARSPLDDHQFREKIAAGLRCDELDPARCRDSRQSFLRRCFYNAGAYDNPDDYRTLVRRMGPTSGILWYLAIPPSVFSPTIRALGESGLADESSFWSRVIIEKPFGRDRSSSDRLTREIAAVFRESQVFRIDHYLGKEVVQNLMVLRFANTVFEPLWNRHYVSHVHIAWKEDLSLSGRGGYFDSYGIIRDVMQNHLTQMLALTGMECPWGPEAHYVRDEKVRLLRQVPPLREEDLVIGQYRGGSLRGQTFAAYRDAPDVPGDSLTPTYAAAVLRVMSPRWRGMPFLVSAGKGLDRRCTEIRIHFKPVENDLFRINGVAPPANELVIRVQPGEDIHFRIVGKRPGFEMALDTPKMDLPYSAAYAEQRIADAYENLLLDAIRGERSLFIRDDELAAAWDIFTPVLAAMENGRRVPEDYDFGGVGPPSVAALARRYGIDDPHA